jgi:hypothetical protein
MIRLDGLRHVFGGELRELDGRRWLETHVGGLRVFVIAHVDQAGGLTFELAVFTPHARELHPFFARDEVPAWHLVGERAPPRLEDGFVITGCHRGILFARGTGAPSLEDLVGTLWELARWAREPWRPGDLHSGFEGLRARRRARRARWIRIVVVVLVVALILWPRPRAAEALLALLVLLASPPGAASTRARRR